VTYWQTKIVDVPDWPKPGIVFKDITPLLADGPAFADVTRAFAEAVRPWRPTQIVGIESRGFIFGAALADRLGLGLSLVRKKGKLPRATRRVTYALEYGEDVVEMHADALGPNDRAVVIDDVLATGGTARAVAELVQHTGATLAGMAFLMELAFLPGRTRLPAGVDVRALLTIG